MEKDNYRNSKILIVDDDINVLNATKRNLKTIEVEAITNNNPEEAIEYLKVNKVDLVLLDFFMPEMTGEDFIGELRKFDNKTIVYLHTGESGQVPSDEMMDKLNIQGYIDKSKGIEEILLSVKSALKTASLLKTISKQEEIINAQQYKNEFLGKFLNRLMGEIRERGMATAGSIVHLEEIEKSIPNDIKETFLHSVSTIKSNISKLNELIKSLEINEEVMVNASELKHILENLFTITMSIKDVTLNIECENEHLVLECKRDIILHIMVEIIEELINSNEKNINIVIEKNETVKIKICNKISNKEIIEKLNKLAYSDEKISISEECEQLVINIG